MKHCLTCKRTKRFGLFSKDKYSKDGHRSQCKACTSVYMVCNKERLEKARLSRPINKIAIRNASRKYKSNPNNKRKIIIYYNKYYKKNKKFLIFYQAFVQYGERMGYL